MSAHQDELSRPGREIQEEPGSVLMDSFKRIRRQLDSHDIEEILIGCKDMKSLLEDNRKPFRADYRINHLATFALSGLATRLFQLMSQYSENVSAKQQFVTLLLSIAHKSAFTVAKAHGSGMIFQELKMQQELPFKYRIVVLATTLARKNRQVCEILLQAEVLPFIFGFVAAEPQQPKYGKLIDAINVFTSGKHRPVKHEYVAKCLGGVRKMLSTSVETTLRAALTAVAFLVVPHEVEYGCAPRRPQDVPRPEANVTIQALIDADIIQQIVTCLFWNFGTDELRVATLNLIALLATGSLEQVAELMKYSHTIISAMQSVALADVNSNSSVAVAMLVSRLLVRSTKDICTQFLATEFVSFLSAYSKATVAGSLPVNSVAMLALTNLVITAKPDQRSELQKLNVLAHILEILLLPDVAVVQRALVALLKYLEDSPSEPSPLAFLMRLKISAL